MKKLLLGLTLFTSMASYGAEYSCSYVVGTDLSRGRKNITISEARHEFLITSNEGKNYYLMDNGSLAGIVVKNGRTIIKPLVSSGTRIISYRESLDSGDGTEVGPAEMFVTCIKY